MKLTELEQEILDCKFCPFQEYSFNQTKELGFGEKFKILFIGLAPAITSNKSKGESRFDKFFQGLLAKIEISREDYYFTNLIKTSVPKNVIPTHEQIKHCVTHAMKEIFEVKPQIIVLFGKQVRDAFDVNWPGVSAGRIFTLGDKKMKTYLFATQHPGFLHYDPDKETTYLRSLKKALSTYKHILL